MPLMVAWSVGRSFATIHLGVPIEQICILRFYDHFLGDLIHRALFKGHTGVGPK